MKKIVGFLCLLLSVFFWAAPSWALDALEVQALRQKAQVSFQPMEEGKVLVSVQDKGGEAILNLKKEDFSIKQGIKTAKILSVEDVQEQRNIGLNIVLVVDNSYSMEQRKAVEPLLAAMNSFLTLVRPIDNVHVVTFVDPGSKEPRVSTRTFQANEVSALGQALRSSFFPATTDGTYLYDSMQKGLEIIGQMPADSQKFMLVFSDGEDINSQVKGAEVALAAKGVQNFSAFAVDYMDKPGLDPFLTTFAQGHNGMIRKATSASDFLPILKKFSTTIFHRYVVTYRFLNPPAGTLVSVPPVVNIEEITVVDSSPMLNHVYFDTGKSRIPERYVALSGPEATAGFAEEKLKDTMEKHHQVLNVIGKRLLAKPEARITLVGCNSNTGVERGKVGLAKSRAEAVAAYLKGIWGIDPSRMEIKARNLPLVPSSSRVPEGIVENQRVEILASDPAILDTIKSSYVQEQSDTKELRLTPSLQAEVGIEHWQLKLLGAEKVLGTQEGTGDLPAEVVFALAPLGLHNLAQLGQLRADLSVKDKEGNTFSTTTPIAINFLRREERSAQKTGNKVIEKYGLILFDFDRAEVKDRNQVIVNRVLARVAELKGVAMDIAGHTDSIGKEKYNIDLSGRRAKAVYDTTLKSGIAAAAQINHVGNGPNNPPYDNSLPEGRSLNRTVIINLQYTE
ncbi:OmpA family protein [Thiovibrio frasassiensis]|uniref:OmpA family protein n=1 Tax=Thiovibrio frasassiensis TaxID=2984131 RepID=A0A9X4MHW7_9BACT|nr:OmpA family protein [Thiovibrio frasassiensis]MDG4476170.1 OmpA family protein [Thiovibrio frasassiensis]